MLKKAEIVARLAKASPTNPVCLWLDTSAVYGARTLTLGDAVSAWQERHNAPLEALQLHISPLVFAERNAQERRELGRDFNPSIVWATLQSKQVRVSVFDAPAADLASARLARWFETKDAWKDAKWKRVCEMYGQTKDRPNRHLSATVDWLIAASVPEDWIVVTDDRGDEFRQTGEAAKYKVVLEAVRVS